MSEPRAMIVAIDGPAGAGKSTVAKAVAQAVGYVLVDTGAIYRALAWRALRDGIALEDESALAQLAGNLDIRFVEHAQAPTQVFVGPDDVTDAIRTREIARAVSVVSAHGEVRRQLVALQRHFAGQGNAVLEGRDIGTVICPHAPVKFFLVASLQERARRRHEELLLRDDQAVYEEVLAEIEARDAGDEGRKVAPLKAASDAIRLDCTRMSADDVVAAIVARIRTVEAAAHELPEGVSKTEVSARAVLANANAVLPAQPLDDETDVGYRAAVLLFFGKTLPERLQQNPQLCESMQGTYLFNITGGKHEQRFLLDCRSTPAKVGPAAMDAHALCTIGVRAEHLLAMVRGSLNPQLAFMQGHLHVQGDLAMALRLGVLFA